MSLSLTDFKMCKYYKCEQKIYRDIVYIQHFVWQERTLLKSTSLVPSIIQIRKLRPRGDNWPHGNHVTLKYSQHNSLSQHLVSLYNLRKTHLTRPKQWECNLSCMSACLYASVYAKEAKKLGNADIALGHAGYSLKDGSNQGCVENGRKT